MAIEDLFGKNLTEVARDLVSDLVELTEKGTDLSETLQKVSDFIGFIEAANTVVRKNEDLDSKENMIYQTLLANFISGEMTPSQPGYLSWKRRTNEKLVRILVSFVINIEETNIKERIKKVSSKEDVVFIVGFLSLMAYEMERIKK